MVLPPRKAVELPGAPPPHLKKKTMIKDQIGVVRTTSYDLPGTTHVYGKADIKDSEDAGVVMSRWMASTPSQPKESQRSFIKTNRCALQEGCLSAKSQREYAQAHQDIRFNQPSGRNPTAKHYEVPFKGPYGAVSKTESQSIRRLIEADYTDWVADGVDYPDLSALEQKRKLKKPQPTRASVGHDCRSKGPEQKHEPFKMKKFANIKGRISYA